MHCTLYKKLVCSNKTNLLWRRVHDLLSLDTDWLFLVQLLKSRQGLQMSRGLAPGYRNVPDLPDCSFTLHCFRSEILIRSQVFSSFKINVLTPDWPLSSRSCTTGMFGLPRPGWGRPEHCGIRCHRASWRGERKVSADGGLGGQFWRAGELHTGWWHRWYW